jgi:general secretion pathway protein N
MITRRSVVLLLIAFAIGLVAFLPARMLETTINSNLTPAEVSLRGTIWNGSGQLKSATLLLPLAWQFEPAALLRLRAGWRLEALSPQLTGAASIGAGFGSIEIRQADLSLDAATLPQLHRDLALVGLMGPSGRMAISIADGFTAAYGNVPKIHGEALLKIDRIALSSLSPQPLGNYQVKLTARDNILDYAIVEASGALKLDGGGSATLINPRQFSFAGNATAAAGLPDSMVSALKSVSQPLPDGRLRIDYKGRW